MSLFNFTTARPTASPPSSTSTTCGCQTSEFESKQYYTYLVVSIIQLILTFVGLIYVHFYLKRKDDKADKERLEKKDERLEKEAREKQERLDKKNERLEKEKRVQNERLEKEAREKQERLDKEERDKIADIIDKEYYKIDQNEIIERLTTFKKKLENMVLFHGTIGENEITITGLDIMKYKLQELKNLPKGREFFEDLNNVYKMCLRLHIKLPIKENCPTIIKEELGPFIIEAVEVLNSFLSANKRYSSAISNVMRYFGSEEVATVFEKDILEKCFPYIDCLSCGVSRNVNESHTVFTDYLSHESINFDFKIKYDSSSMTSKEWWDMKQIENTLRSTSKKDDLPKFITGIEESLSRSRFDSLPKPDWNNKEYLQANVLHAVRVFMFYNIQDTGLNSLIQEMVEEITKVSVERVKNNGKSEQEIAGITSHLETLEKNPDLREQKSIAEALKNANEAIRKAISEV